MQSDAVGTDGAAEEMQALRDQLAQALLAVRARDEFLAIAAHELRNPMHTAALTISTVLAQSVAQGDAELERRARRAQRAIETLVRRASLLLDVSRLNDGSFVLRRRPADLADCLRAAVAQLDDQARHVSSPLRLDCPGSLPGLWDIDALAQVADNLITNAVKYGAGQPVQVRAWADDRGTAFSVSDGGPGIAAADRQRIFDKFERLMQGACARTASGWACGSSANWCMPTAAPSR
ncbi:sensor histidine kinase KdpD [Aquabacterium sp. J223]|uniref:sensor histidine kinase n=1 Tax=Aquabacterium sp. J223 TaxID=2898431 RepID=UPI0021ADF16F|nr:HAMP domain-containing sensor histidine kinase [Aquabacterium sp. J223]UUX94444.1 HAMP domain-containing histidine kinase [Aquabacterium sp. J223]